MISQQLGRFISRLKGFTFLRRSSLINRLISYDRPLLNSTILSRYCPTDCGNDCLANDLFFFPSSESSESPIGPRVTKESIRSVTSLDPRRWMFRRWRLPARTQKDRLKIYSEKYIRKFPRAYRFFAFEDFQLSLGVYSAKYARVRESMTLRNACADG